MPDTEAILAANAELAKAVDGLSRQVRSLGHRTKSIVVIVLVLTLLIVGVIVNGVRVNRAEDRAHRVQEYLTVSCVSANESRKATRDLWSYILKLTGENPQQTATEKKQAVQFQKYVSVAYADKDCTQVAK